MLICHQAYERQVDHLGRQLSRDASESDEVCRERSVLLEELSAAQGVRHSLERAREELQVRQGL